MFKQSILFKSLMLLKLGGIVAKLSVFVTVISTLATLLNSIQGELGGAINAVCAATYLVAKSISIYQYDKTQHISPIAIPVENNNKRSA